MDNTAKFHHKLGINTCSLESHLKDLLCVVFQEQNIPQAFSFDKFGAQLRRSLFLRLPFPLSQCRVEDLCLMALISLTIIIFLPAHHWLQHYASQSFLYPNYTFSASFCPTLLFLFQTYIKKLTQLSHKFNIMLSGNFVCQIN